MTSGGELERVPIKVVPYYVQPLDSEPEPPILDVEPEAPSRLRWLPGLAALVLAVSTAIVHGTAIAAATGGDFAGGELLGYVAVGLSIGSFVVGAAAILLGRGRAFGVAAVLLGVLANPVVLLKVLELAAGLGS